MGSTLRSRPSAETFPLEDLVDLARDGRVRVPSFQRGLRWTRSDVVLLFDSILKGYPLGSLLLWERRAPAEPVTLGSLRIDAPKGDAFYVVDGQQRITALACALTAEAAEDTRFRIGYDLARDSFVPGTASPPESYVPAYVLFDHSALLRWFRDHPELTDHFDAAAAVAKTLRDLKIPAYVVRQNDEEVLRSIFDRMNNAGKKLTRGEVFAALHRPTDGTGPGTLQSMAESVQARTGFGLLDRNAVMQLVLARRGADITREIRHEFRSSARGRDDFAAGESEGEALLQGEEAAVRAIEFIQGVTLVPHIALLPYLHLLVVLSRLFAYHPHLTKRHERLLRRFFWRSVVTSLGRGVAPQATRTLNDTIVPGDERASVARLVAITSGLERPSVRSVNPFRTNTAATKALLCAVWEHGPRSLVTGEPVSTEELQRELGERSTPVDLVATLAPTRYAGDRVKEAGNRLLLAPSQDRESDALDELARAADPRVPASHLLESSDLIVLRGNDAVAVIEQRNGRLEELQAAFFERMCEWDQEDTPDLAGLIHDEPEEDVGLRSDGEPADVPA